MYPQPPTLAEKGRECHDNFHTGEVHADAAPCADAKRYVRSTLFMRWIYKPGGIKPGLSQ